jgi:hypothetical protein
MAKCTNLLDRLRELARVYNEIVKILREYEI